jgi:hypothetical protein
VDTTYTGVATGPGGSVQAQITVTINAGGGDPPGTPVDSDIVDANGVIVPASFDEVFRNYADVTAGRGIGYRYGPAASATGVATLQHRPDIGRIRYGGNGTAPPDVWFQYGGENSGTWFNDFVTNNSAVISAYKSGTSAWSDLQGVLLAYAIDRHTVNQRSQLPWQNAVFQPEQIDAYLAMGATNGLDPNDPADRPIIEHRHPGGADHDNCRMGFAATQGSDTRPSKLYCLGTVTARIPGIVTLPLGYIPTSVSVTNGAELAIVTAVHRTNRTGHLLFIALGGTAAGVHWQDDPNDFYAWWHEMTDMVHPLFKNRGGWSFMKYIGKVDLPANCSAPTHSHTQTGFDPTEVIYYGPTNSDIGGLGDVVPVLANARARFLPGGDLYRYVTKGGVCTVISQSEKSIVFVDISPLFEYVNDMYFGSAAKNLETQYYYYNGTGAPASGLASVGKNYLNNANGDVYQKTNDTTWSIIGNIGTKRGVGMGTNNFPYLFTDLPGTALPVVVKTIVSTSRLRGVLGTYSYGYDSRNDTRREPGTPGYPMADPHYPRIWVAADGDNGLGEIQIYKAETYTPGRQPAPVTRSPADIIRVGTVSDVAEQITCLAVVKDYDVGLEGVVYDPNDSPPGPIDKCVAFNSRKNRFIKVIQFQGSNGSTAQTIGTMADSRMDCTSFAFVDAYYNTNKVITMTNFTGQSVDNYRMASPVPMRYPTPQNGTPIVYPTLSGVAGPPSTGGEFAGSFAVNGYPFQIHCSNAP